MRLAGLPHCSTSFEHNKMQKKDQRKLGALELVEVNERMFCNLDTHRQNTLQ